MANESQSTNEDKGLSKDDIFDELNKDDGGVVKDKEKEEEVDEDEDEEITGKEDEDDEDDEEEKEEIKLVEDEDDDDKELKDIKEIGPFRRKDLERDFPGVLKKYPYLEQSYYRDRAFTEVFASPEDAKEAQEQIESLNEIENSLLNGSSAEILGRVKEHDSKAFLKLVDNYLPSLNKVDPAAHDHIVGGVVKNLITMLAREAKSTDNDELRKVALAINKFVFQSDEFEPHRQLGERADETDKVAEERKAFLTERFEIVQEELQTKVDDIITATIRNNIDPKDLLSDYVKKNAVRDAMETLRETLEQDSSFRKTLDKLWERAFANNFNRDSVNAIRAAYLGKAKVAIVPAIKKARNEALKGIGKRVREDKGDSDTQKTEQEKPTYFRGEKAKSRGSSSSNNRGQKAADIPKGMSTLDYLNKD